MISHQTGWARTTTASDFPEHSAILKALYELAGRGPCLDLGCGEAHVTKTFDDCTMVDLNPRLNPKFPVIPQDIRTFQPTRHFNLLVMGDVLEHLRDEDARALLRRLDRHCGAMSIFTPVGPFRMDPGATDPHAHKSAWYPEQFWSEGWEVWEFPTCHRFEGGQILGAFWAWKFRDRPTPPAEAVAQMAAIEL